MKLCVATALATAVSVCLLCSPGANASAVPRGEQQQQQHALGADAFSPRAPTEHETRIHRLMASLDENTDRMRYYTTYLTGEHPDSRIVTRQSFSDSGAVAAGWIRDQLAGMGFSASLHHYNRTTNGRQWNPNVVAELWPSNSRDFSTPTVVVGAHYDNSAVDVNSPTARAPGANDGASGTALLLQLAAWIAEHNVRFATRVTLIAFSGQTQGNVGSAAWVEQARANGIPVQAMVYANMVGYTEPRYGNSSVAAIPSTYFGSYFAKKLIRWTGKYVPELSLYAYSSEWGYDDYTFDRAGIDSGMFVGGGTRDKEFHGPGDLVNRPNFILSKIVTITKAVLASLCEAAELVSA